MKNKIRTIAKHPLISGSFFIVSGTFFGNIFNFLFSWYMISALKDRYAIVASIVSLVTLPALAANAISPVLIKYAAAYFARRELLHIKGLYIKAMKFYGLIATVLFVCFLVITPAIITFLKINNQFLLLLANGMIFISFLHVINMAFLQAKLSFRFITIISIFSAAIKFILGYGLLHFGEQGAVISIFLSFLLPFLLGFLPLKDIITNKNASETLPTKELVLYGIPSALTILGVNMFINIDILLVKHFFSLSDASLYAAVSLPAKVIFYLTSPINTVMFPLIVQKKSKGERYLDTFIIAFLLILIPSLILVLYYFFVPDFILYIFQIHKTAAYTPRLLGLFGVFIMSFSLISTLTNYYLAINKTKIYYMVLCSACLQIILIWLYHKSLEAVVVMSCISSIVLLFLLLLYYPYASRKQ